MPPPTACSIRPAAHRASGPPLPAPASGPRSAGHWSPRHPRPSIVHRFRPPVSIGHVPRARWSPCPLSMACLVACFVGGSLIACALPLFGSPAACGEARSTGARRKDAGHLWGASGWRGGGGREPGGGTRAHAEPFSSRTRRHPPYTAPPLPRKPVHRPPDHAFDTPGQGSGGFRPHRATISGFPELIKIINSINWPSGGLRSGVGDWKQETPPPVGVTGFCIRCRGFGSQKSAGGYVAGCPSTASRSARMASYCRITPNCTLSRSRSPADSE